MAVTRTLEDGTVQTFIAGMGWFNTGTNGVVTNQTSGGGLLDTSGSSTAASTSKTGTSSTQAAEGGSSVGPVEEDKSVTGTYDSSQNWQNQYADQISTAYTTKNEDDYRKWVMSRWNGVNEQGIPTIDGVPDYNFDGRTGSYQTADGIWVHNTSTGTNRASQDTGMAGTQQFMSGWLSAGYGDREVSVGDYTGGRYTGEGDDPRLATGGSVEERDQVYQEQAASRQLTEARSQFMRERGIDGPVIYGGTSLVKAAFTNKGVFLLDENGMPTGNPMTMEQWEGYREQVRADDWIQKFSTLGAQVTYDPATGRYFAIGPTGKKYDSSSAPLLWKDLWEEAGGTSYSGNLWDPYPDGYVDPRIPGGGGGGDDGGGGGGGSGGGGGGRRPDRDYPDIPPIARPVFRQPYLSDEFYKDWMSGWGDRIGIYGPPEGGLVPEGGIDFSRYFSADAFESFRPGAMGIQHLPVGGMLFPGGGGGSGGGDTGGGTGPGGGGADRRATNEDYASILSTFNPAEFLNGTQHDIGGMTNWYRTALTAAGFPIDAQAMAYFWNWLAEKGIGNYA